MKPAKRIENPEGRKVGVELELGGLQIDRISAIVREAVGGTIEKENRYQANIRESSVGDIKVELDAVLFTEFKLRGFLKKLPVTKEKKDLADLIEETLASEASRWVPFELVFSPIPFDRISELEAVSRALSAEAEGTGASVFNAFGLHFNPELPKCDAPTVLRYLRAFLVLYDSLKKSHDIDPSRKATPFIEPFPKAYAQLVLDSGYNPDEQELISDYLEHNATRNRPLDLLPLFAHMQEGLVRDKLPEEKINPRPTLHYRMPDCRIDDPDWSISHEWKIYLQVEQLAADPDKLESLARGELSRLAHPLRAMLRRWAAYLKGVSMTERPIIAVTGPDKGGWPAWIFTALAVWRAGGKPLRLRPGRFGKGQSLPQFDGLIIGGGADIEPSKAGISIEALRPDDDAAENEEGRLLARIFAPVIFLFRGIFAIHHAGVDERRDAFEEQCLSMALENDRPILGICRGAQLVNIHFGGDLHGELFEFYGEKGSPDSVYPRKPIHVTEGSLLEKVLERRTLAVNSLHKQAVKTIGKELTICARDEAGVIQAIESEKRAFVIGVQWHPEYLPTLRVQQRLFRRLVQRAGASI